MANPAFRHAQHETLRHGLSSVSLGVSAQPGWDLQLPLVNQFDKASPSVTATSVKGTAVNFG